MPHTLLYFLALFSLATAPNWAKLNHMPVEVLGFYRLGIAALLLAGWIILKKIIQKPKLDQPANILTNRLLSKATLWAIFSGFLFFLHLWTYKYAAKSTSISNTMIIFSSNPIWASIGTIVFFKEKISKRLIFSYFLALLGVYILLAHDFNIGSAINYGDWSAVISALFYAAYMLTGKKARDHFDNNNYALVQYAVCALFFGFCILGTNASITGYDLTSWLAVAGLVLLPTFLGHFSFTYLVKHMNLSVMTCGKLIEPLLASIMAYFVFQEKISPYAWVAFALTGTSVLVLFGPAVLKKINNLWRARLCLSTIKFRIRSFFNSI